MWVEPIVDRTLADVLNKAPKAYLNASDYNRIEGNCAVLAAALGVNIQTKNWSMTDFPKVSELQRIIDNVQVLRDAYHTYATTPATPINPINEYGKVNALEQILGDLYAILQDNLSALVYAGELYAGGTGVI